MNYITTIKNHPLGVVLLILPIAVFVKNIAGGVHGIQTNKWNFEYFKRGIFKGFSLYLIFALITAIAWLSSDFLITVGGTDYGLVEALVFILTGAIALYLRDTFIIIQAIFVAKSTEEEQ